MSRSRPLTSTRLAAAFRLVAVALCALVVGAAPVHAIVANAVDVGPGPRVRLLGRDAAPAGAERDAGDQARIQVRRAAVEAALERRAGAAARFVRIEWNERTGLPHRLYGVPLPGSAMAPLDDAATAGSAGRAFLAADPALWAGDERPARDDLALVKARRVGRTWFLAFQQRHRGLDVVGGRVDLRLRDDGAVLLLGADWFPGVNVDPLPRLARGVADANVRREVGFDAGRDRLVEAATRILPVPAADGTIAYRLAHRVRHRIADPPALWASDVDATTGITLARENQLRYDTLVGAVTGSVRLASPTDVPVSRPFRDAVVAWSLDSTTTAANGRYALPNINGAFLIKTALRGPWLEVLHAAANEAAQTLTAPASDTLDFTWTPANSDTSERDAFYHAHVAHDWVKSVDPAFTALDYRMPCTVNVNSQCNAFWDGLGINFYRWGLRPSDGKACANTASIADVVYHEYGHGITQEVFAPFEPSGAMHEGFSDYTAATITNQPQIGRGFFGPGTSIRTTANTQRIDAGLCAGAVHCVGNALSGALWDLRGRLVTALGAGAGVELADSLFHYAGFGGAEWHDDYLLDLLLVDDDDGTLLNGTPHSADICAAFGARGIPCPDTTSGVWIVHQPLPDANPDAGPFLVDASIGSFAGAFDAASPVLRWRVAGLNVHAVAMASLGGDLFRATIPALPSGGRIEYTIEARDLGAGPATSPAGAPAAVHAFHVGTLSTAWSDDFAIDRGWSSIINGADTGRWMRVDPNGTNSGGTPPFEFSPEDDHTPGPGGACYVTQDTTAGLVAGIADVDGACVTLLSPRIDLSALANARLGYAHWFVDETRRDDTLRVDISADDGATWLPLERLPRSELGWNERAFDLGSRLPLTTQFRMRVSTCDYGGGSLLEAGLDDVLITTRAYGVVGVDDPLADGAAVPSVAFLARPEPNPTASGAATRIAFGVPAAAAGLRVRLELLDVRGRAVRTLVDGALPPGRHARVWDGLDGDGRRVAAGVYFVRLGVGEMTGSEKVIRME